MTALERWKVIYNHNVTWFQGRAGGEVEKGPMLVLECPTGHRLFLMHPAAKAGAVGSARAAGVRSPSNYCRLRLSMLSLLTALPPRLRCHYKACSVDKTGRAFT